MLWHLAIASALPIDCASAGMIVFRGLMKSPLHNVDHLRRLFDVRPALLPLYRTQVAVTVDESSEEQMGSDETDPGHPSWSFFHRRLCRTGCRSRRSTSRGLAQRCQAIHHVERLRGQR